MLGPDATQQDIQGLRAQLGLDRPLGGQYVVFLEHTLQGDLGQSIFLGLPALTAVAERAEPTFLLTVFAIVIAATIALPISILAAYRRDSWFDRAATTLAMLAASIPSFWLGLLLIQWFAVRLGIFPVSGYGGPGADLMSRLHHLVLPATSLGIAASAIILRFTRASMLDVLGDDYVRTARSKGMSEWRPGRWPTRPMMYDPTPAAVNTLAKRAHLGNVPPTPKPKAAMHAINKHARNPMDAKKLGAAHGTQQTLYVLVLGGRLQTAAAVQPRQGGQAVLQRGQVRRQLP